MAVLYKTNEIIIEKKKSTKTNNDYYQLIIKLTPEYSKKVFLTDIELALLKLSGLIKE